MTLELRQRHRQIIPVLALTLGICLVVAIIEQRPVPELETLPTELTPQRQTFSATGEEHESLFGKFKLRVRLWREQESGATAIDFIAPRDFLKADLVAYWSPVQPPVEAVLPSDATLMGAFGAGPLALPLKASKQEGYVILFSVATREVVDVSRATRLAQTPKLP